MIDQILNILGIGTGTKIMPLPRDIGKPKVKRPRTEADGIALHKAAQKRRRKNLKRAQDFHSHTV